MKQINQKITIICSVFTILCFISSCKEVKPLKNTTNSEDMNLKGNVCLIIQEDFDIQNGKRTSSNTTIFKFNHLKNLLKESKGKEVTNYSYDNSGRLIVEKHSKDIITLSEETDFINVSDYKKYYYKDDNVFPYKVEEYYGSENSLNAITLIERDKYNYKTKTTKVEYKKDPFSHKTNNDTTMMLFKNNGNNKYTEIEIRQGKRVLLEKYDINKKGQIISKHIKDLNVITDTIPTYILEDIKTWKQKKSYNYVKYDNNILTTYERNENGDLVHILDIDSTENKRHETYAQYTYDEKGNWTKREIFNSLHELVAIATRRIEYYPEKENGEIDFSFEKEKTPLEKEFEKEQIIKRKEELYLNDNFIIQQFYEKMKEYPDYKVTGEPKITFHEGYTYNINFNATHYYGGYPNGYPSKENITVQIILDLETETYTFTAIKGQLY